MKYPMPCHMLLQTQAKSIKLGLLGQIIRIIWLELEL